MKEVDYQEVFPKIIPQIKDGAFLVVRGKERTNVMTFGWATFGFVWRRPVMMVAVRKTRFTHGIIEETDSFIVSVPKGDMKMDLRFVLAGEEGDPGLLEEVQGGADGRAGNDVGDDWFVESLGREDMISGASIKRVKRQIHEYPPEPPLSAQIPPPLGSGG